MISFEGISAFSHWKQSIHNWHRGVKERSESQQLKRWSTQNFMQFCTTRKAQKVTCLFNVSERAVRSDSEKKTYTTSINHDSESSEVDTHFQTVLFQQFLCFLIKQNITKTLVKKFLCERFLQRVETKFQSGDGRILLELKLNMVGSYLNPISAHETHQTRRTMRSDQILTNERGSIFSPENMSSNKNDTYMTACFCRARPKTMRCEFTDFVTSVSPSCRNLACVLRSSSMLFTVLSCTILRSCTRSFAHFNFTNGSQVASAFSARVLLSAPQLSWPTCRTYCHTCP